MTKLTFTDLTSLANPTSFLNTLNANFALIETFSDTILNRNGTAPNTLTATLDVNSQRLINLVDPTDPQEPATKAYVDDIVTAAGSEVVGAGSSVANNLVAFNGTSGAILKDSGIPMADVPQIDTANTWTLAQSFTLAPRPTTNDGAALGVPTTAMWSDLYLASGGFIDWNNNDVRITHSANFLNFSGASSGYQFDSHLFPAANDGGQLGASANQWSDVFLATGGVLNWNNGNLTMTHSAGAMTVTGTWTFNTRPVFNGNTPWDTGNMTIATQAEQEAAASTTAVVTSGRQHFHPSAAKCWAVVTVSAGTPTLQTSYNITSITDTGAGILTVTIATDFSTANWAAVCTAEGTTGQERHTLAVSKAAGTCNFECYNAAGAQTDPTSWNILGFGDHA